MFAALEAETKAARKRFLDERKTKLGVEFSLGDQDEE